MPGKTLIYWSMAVLILLVAVITWQWPSFWPRFVMCDVGQGDALLISHGFVQVLIDGGRDDRVIDCLNSYMPFWDQHLELVVLTHPDADHYGGLATVLQTYTVEKLLIGATKESADFDRFWEFVQIEQQSGMQIMTPSQGQWLVVSKDVLFEVLWPPGIPQAETRLSAYSHQKTVKKQQEINYNDESIALLLHFGTTLVLMVGDLEAAGEQALLDRGLLLDVDILKVGHHGSKTSSTPAFLAEIRPEFSLISLGKNNSYGHPHPEVLQRLEDLGSQIMRTDLLGSIVLRSSDTSFWFE